VSVHDVPQIDTFQAKDVAELIQARAWPSVTLLLETTPAERMSSREAEQLQRLVEDAERQLAARDVLGSEIRRHIMGLAADARSAPTGRGLAIFASQSVQRIYRLPAPVATRAVVEQTFRTRDLVQTLHRTPPHLLLILHPTFAQLYRGYGDTFLPLTDPGFPSQRALPQLGLLAGGEDRLEDFLNTVDRFLGRARSRHPAPIIVVGDRNTVSRFVRRSRNLHRLAGVITQPSLDTVQLYAAIRVSIEEYLLSREDEALMVLEEAKAEAPQTVHSGVQACWDAAHAMVPATLLVEEGFTFPAVIDDRGLRRIDFLRAPEAAPIGARSDLIDDLIEVVIDRGGWVAFTRNGRLTQHHRLALVTSAHRPDVPVTSAPRRTSRGPGTPPP